MTKRVSIALAVMMATAGMWGCGKSRGGDIAGEAPEVTAKAFADAMKRGDLKTAATGYAYDSEAREKNSDWADIPQGQRNSIIAKLEENKAKALEAMEGQFKSGAEVTDVQTDGSQATVTFNIQGGTLTLPLVQVDGKWRISGSE
jgi:hypothetical protein